MNDLVARAARAAEGHGWRLTAAVVEPSLVSAAVDDFAASHVQRRDIACVLELAKPGSGRTTRLFIPWCDIPRAAVRSVPASSEASERPKRHRYEIDYAKLHAHRLRGVIVRAPPNSVFAARNDTPAPP